MVHITGKKWQFRPAGQQHRLAHALAASVDDVSPELLEAYVEMFQKIEHRKIGSALRQSIQQGSWLPTSATEYMQRFIAFASGTGTPS